MRLKDFIERYERERGPHDFITAYYEMETGRRAERRHIGENEIMQAKRSGGLLLEADIIESHIYDTEGTSLNLSGGGRSYKCRQWSAKLDADQAAISQGRHPIIDRKTANARNKPKRKKTR